MQRNALSSQISRGLALGLGVALIGGMTLFGAAPAQALAPTYSISGWVNSTDSRNLSGVSVAIENGPMTTSDASAFTLSELVDGVYDITFAYTNYETQTRNVTVAGADVRMDSITLEKLPDLVAGTVTFTGSQTVGSTLTATTSGWPEGTTFSYGWGAVAPGQQNSSDLVDATTATLVVTEETVGRMIWVQVGGSKSGFADTYAHFNGPQPQRIMAATPVVDSADLAAWLLEKESTPASQVSAGLPDADLDPAKAYTADVKFTADDAYADVYLYSSPISVGTFPVVNGVVQVPLSTAVLSQLAAGTHTLVVVGQFSSQVSSVAISVGAVADTVAAADAALAETGLDSALPVGAAATLLLLGAMVMVLVRRRQRA